MIGARFGLLVAVAVLQGLAIAGFVATRPPSARGVAVVGVATAVAADTIAARPLASLAPLAGVVGLSVLATVVVQLVRGVARARVTEAMASTLGLALATVALATLLVLRRQLDGAAQVIAYALAAGVALVVAAGVDLVLPKPPLAAEVHRGALALVLGTVAGALAGAVAASPLSLSRPEAALFGGGVALVAVLVDLAGAYALAGAEPLPSYAFLAGPLSAFVAAAPVAYLLGALMVG